MGQRTLDRMLVVEIAQPDGGVYTFAAWCRDSAWHAVQAAGRLGAATVFDWRRTGGPGAARDGWVLHGTSPL
jgi:hypothetical protein